MAQRWSPQKMPRFGLLLVLLSAACNALAQPTPTRTLIPTATPSETMSVTATVAATATNTPSPTITLTATQTPTATWTPSITPTPTLTLTPSITPLPTTVFRFDNWEQVEIPQDIRGGIDRPLIAFLNTNNKETIANLSTAQPATNVETLYYTSPTNAVDRVEILQLKATTNNRVYVAPRGNAVAYFREEGADTGLYILDLSIGLSGRILPIPTLVQRGIFSKPAWSPDGSRLAVTLATGYDLDIFSFARDGSNWQNLTSSGAYDFWPAYSPDGQYLLFVSDRAKCPSWIPGEPSACDATVTQPPTGGNLFVLNIASGDVKQLSDQWVTEPPRWLNTQKVAFAVSDQTDLLNPQRTLWLADVESGQAREFRLKDGSGTPIYLAEAWSPDGSQVVFQNVGTDTEIVLASLDGTLLGRTTTLNFARFSMSAAWSPDGQRLVIGGVNGQCPYGIAVFNTSLDLIARDSPPPSMCDPVWSPDGNYIAFTGVSPRVDGRVDVYSANFNGFSAANLTVDLRGQIAMLGWVGGNP